MGSFSFTKADNLTEIANIVEDKPFKFLIPKEFGGGFIKDHYQGYGEFDYKENGDPKYDMYEILAFWNREACENIEGEYSIDSDKEISGIVYDGEFNPLPEISSHTFHNRILGINIGCYDDQIDKLKYPLKLVSASYTGTYEDCLGRSYDDPEQGWRPLYRDSYKYTKMMKDKECLTENLELQRWYGVYINN